MTNQLANDSSERRSGVIAWPGSNVPFNERLPSKIEKYDPNRSLNSTLNIILSWFREPIDTRINFGVVYHFQPDVNGNIITTEYNDLYNLLIFFRTYLWSNISSSKSNIKRM